MIGNPLPIRGVTENAMTGELTCLACGAKWLPPSRSEATIDREMTAHFRVCQPPEITS